MPSSQDEARRPLIEDQEASHDTTHNNDQQTSLDSPQNANQPNTLETHGRLREEAQDQALYAEANKPEQYGTHFIWLLTLSAGISGLLFGYDTGVISSTLVALGSDLSDRPLTILEKALITSSTSLFALLASLPSGLLTDSLGRKTVIIAADILFVVGAIWQALTDSVWGMILGRSVVGLAIGSASFVAPLYIAELAPKGLRGRLVTVQALFITAGQVVAYGVGWGFSNQQGGWRWMVGLGAVPAVLQVGLMMGLPDTPRWLVQAGRGDEARVVLERVYGRDSGGRGISNVMAGIRRDLKEEHGSDQGYDPATSIWSSLRNTLHNLIRVPAHRRALIISCTLQASQQSSGFNSLMYFSTTIFSLIGFKSPTLTALSIAVTNFIFTLVAFRYIDRIGRRRILLWSVPVMVLGLALSAIAFIYVKIDVSDDGSGGLPPPPQGSSQLWSIVLMISLIVYVSAYAIGLGNIPWHQSELFPLPVRSVGSSLATATNWSFNFVVGLTFLPLLQLLGATSTFGLYAVVCAAIWGAIWSIYPETGGLGLEEVVDLLRDGFGVR